MSRPYVPGGSRCWLSGFRKGSVKSSTSAIFTKRINMSNEQLQRLIQHFDKMFNSANMTLMDEIFAADFVAHLPIAPTLNRTSYKLFIRGFYDAFPDLFVEINDAVMSGDRLALRVTYY